MRSAGYRRSRIPNPAANRGGESGSIAGVVFEECGPGVALVEGGGAESTERSLWFSLWMGKRKRGRGGGVERGVEAYLEAIVMVFGEGEFR